MRSGFILIVLLLAACSPRVLVTPYQIDVQQGNVVTDEMLNKVKPGMTKAQVRFALGTPLIIDPFHADRWDYVYRMRKDGQLVGHSKLTVIFEGDKLKTVEGTVLPPSSNVAGVKPRAPIPVPALALAPDQSPSAKPTALDLSQVESDLEAGSQTPPPAAEAAKPASGEDQAGQSSQAEAQTEQPKKSFGERFMRLIGFGKKDETEQVTAQEKSKAQPEQQPDQIQVGQTDQAQAAPPKASIGERFMRLLGFGKKDETTQQAKLEEKSAAQPEAQPEDAQQEAEPATNTVVTADRSPPPKRSVGERFMRLIGFKSNENYQDPAPPVHTDVDNSVPKISNLSFKQVMRQILGLESDSDKEKAAAAGDIEPGEKVKSAPQGSTWQRFKRLIGVDSDETEVTYTPVDQHTKQANNEAKPDTAKPDTAIPNATNADVPSSEAPRSDAPKP
ncbi:MAG TPA: outer membrane protein assembly factor BamE [Burkholderiales bacterium]|nr:outer membrane protein assembly factor BamE [Burkholderiales bacterium]